MSPTDEPIDISGPVAEICQRLGLDLNNVARLVLNPMDATAEIAADVYALNEHGSIAIDHSTRRPVMETRAFRVTT